ILTHHHRVYNNHSWTVTQYPANSIVVVGGCPVCRLPFGFICCFALRKQKCPNCGADFT
ncbi:hypothetical protein FD754_024291, partial [Muntiacus muntjak]